MALSLVLDLALCLEEFKAYPKYYLQNHEKCLRVCLDIIT